jgi:hypothetical protein
MVAARATRYTLDGTGQLIVARTSIVTLMSRITVGRLRVLSAEEIYEFGPGGELTAELKVVNDTFWVRLLLQGDLVCHVRENILISGVCRGIHGRRRGMQRSRIALQGSPSSNYSNLDVPP